MDTRTFRLWCVYFCCMSLNAWPKSVIHHRKYTKQHGACDAGQLSSDYRLCHYSRYRATSARLADGVGIDKHVLEWSVGPRIDMLWTACLHRSCSSRLPFGRFVFFETFFSTLLAIFLKYFFLIKNNYVVKDLCTYFGVISMWERSILQTAIQRRKIFHSLPLYYLFSSSPSCDTLLSIEILCSSCSRADRPILCI